MPQKKKHAVEVKRWADKLRELRVSNPPDRDDREASLTRTMYLAVPPLEKLDARSDKLDRDRASARMSSADSRKATKEESDKFCMETATAAWPDHPDWTVPEMAEFIRGLGHKRSAGTIAKVIARIKGQALKGKNRRM